VRHLRGLRSLNFISFPAIYVGPFHTQTLYILENHDVDVDVALLVLDGEAGHCYSDWRLANQILTSQIIQLYTAISI
jgi:hypothetical protein